MEEDKKTEEEIREEVKEEVRAELEKETEIKEQAEKENKKVFKKIYNIIITILLLLIIADTAIGIIDMKKLENKEEPVWYLDSKVEETGSSKTTTYNLGIYVVQQIEDEKETKIVLKPFFLKNK